MSLTERPGHTGLVTLAYIQSSRGLEVAAKSPVLRKGCVACHASGYKTSLYHGLNCCSYALVILAYFQVSRGRFKKFCSQCSASQGSELVASKKSVLCCVSRVSL